MPTYARADLVFERGEGVHLTTDDGRRFLDFGAGVAVTALGHCHPKLVDALKAQAETLWHCSNLYRIPGQERLAERLVQASFADTVFFCNSGAEAVEGALKMARRYQRGAGEKARYRVITLEGAFHGRTLATISAGGQEKHLKGFEPAVEGFDHVAAGNLNEMRAAVGPETAAVMVEPVQGEGGIRPMDAEYLRGLRTLCDEFGLLLIFDEVQCGMGRTGRLFAHEWAGVAPDVMALAKGLGGGFPVGAVLATEKAAATLDAGSHGSTFGGNPLAMAVGNAVLDVMLEKGFLEAVGKVAARLRKGLEKVAGDHPAVFAGVRGSGLMLGLICQPEVANGDVVQTLADGGLLTVAAGDNVVRLVPPLVIGPGDVDDALAIIDAAAAGLTGGQKDA